MHLRKGLLIQTAKGTTDPLLCARGDRPMGRRHHSAKVRTSRVITKSRTVDLAESAQAKMRSQFSFLSANARPGRLRRRLTQAAPPLHPITHTPAWRGGRMSWEGHVRFYVDGRTAHG